MILSVIHTVFNYTLLHYCYIQKRIRTTEGVMWGRLFFQNFEKKV